MSLELKSAAEGASHFTVGDISVPVNSNGDNPYVPGEAPYFIDPDSYLEQIMFGIANNLPVLLIGETGVGKTLVVRYLAHHTRNGFRRVNLNGATTIDDFVGKLMVNQQGTYWINGALIDAMLRGDWLLLDEINACLPEIAFVLHSLLDEDRMIVLKEYDGSVIRPHPNFRIFASMNPSEEGRYSGTKVLNEALLDRFPVALRMEYLPVDLEITAVMEQSGNHDQESVTKMVKVANDIRAAIREEKVFASFSTRRIIDWARMAKAFGVMTSARATVLTKVNRFDAEIIEDIIETYF